MENWRSFYRRIYISFLLVAYQRARGFQRERQSQYGKPYFIDFPTKEQRLWLNRFSEQSKSRCANAFEKKTLIGGSWKRIISILKCQANKIFYCVDWIKIFDSRAIFFSRSPWLSLKLSEKHFWRTGKPSPQKFPLKLFHFFLSRWGFPHFSAVKYSSSLKREGRESRSWTRNININATFECFALLMITQSIF